MFEFGVWLESLVLLRVAKGGVECASAMVKDFTARPCFNGPRVRGCLSSVRADAVTASRTQPADRPTLLNNACEREHTVIVQALLETKTEISSLKPVCTLTITPE